MRKGIIKKIAGVLLAAFFLAFNYSSYVQNIVKFPTELEIFEGDTQTLNFRLPLQVKIRSRDKNVLKLNGDSLKDQQYCQVNQPLAIQPVKQGYVNLDFRLFGVIPIKQQII